MGFGNCSASEYELNLTRNLSKKPHLKLQTTDIKISAKPNKRRRPADRRKITMQTKKRIQRWMRFFTMHGAMDTTRNNILENWDRIDVRLQRASALLKQM